MLYSPRSIAKKRSTEDVGLEIGAILRELCRWKGVGIIEAEVCSDHVHMLLEIPPKYSVSSVMGYLKGKSSLAIYERWGNAKFRYRNREFWCKGYYVDTTGKNTQKITEYIRNQLKEDAEQSQLTLDRHTPLRRSLAPLGLYPHMKNPTFYVGVPFCTLKTPR